MIRLKNANWTVTTHIQLRDRKPDQPSAMSENRVRRPRPPGSAFPAKLGSKSGRKTAAHRIQHGGAKKFFIELRLIERKWLNIEVS